MTARPARCRFLPAGILVIGAVTMVTSHGFAISHRELIAPTGGAASDLLGYSVSSAGDVNGDGYADVIVGAYGNDAGGTDAGRAYVYYGGPMADAMADLTLTGEAASDLFGISVSSAGDVNGDGYGDVIVGAAFNDAGGPDAGRAYVYLGSAMPDAVADLTMTGAATSDNFGNSVSSAGDVNGDGYADVIVAASANDAMGTDAGRAYVYYGGPSADAVADLTLSGAAAGDNFGVSVSKAGDVNGDGYSDLIVGAYGDDVGSTDAGAAYVFYGGPLTDAVADLTVTGAAAFDLFGISVSTAGDLNGDGFADVIVGAQNASRAYVYLGGPAVDAVADLLLAGAAGSDLLGVSVSSAGDVNGDGYADVIVGAHANDAGGANAGAAYVYFGGLTLDAVADVTLTGAGAFNFFGSSVSSAGDMNGDGYADVLVGAYGNDSDAGRAYITSIYPYQVVSPNGGEIWVTGLHGTVRWRGHDPADLAVSFDGGATWSTVASGVGGLEENEFTLTAPGPATDLAKVRLTYSGQTSKRSNSDASDGVFRIVRPVVPPAAAHRLQQTLVGAAAGDLSGSSVSSAGDMNGDGYADVIVGAYRNDTGGMDAGRAYVYYGGPGADGVADLILTGASALDNFGFSVSSAGDMNGDGYPDVIVGAYLNDAGGGNAGRAYVYYGGPSADAVADLTLTGTAPGDFFGYSVSSAGDVNGDGYADVIVGAYQNDVAGLNAGRAYVYYGGPLADTVADLTLTGAAESDLFGYSVSSAGDVNGDGFADVLVGVPAGRAHVYHGGPGADTVADLTLTGSAALEGFGSSVSSAGDMNGDGYADVLVGAPQSDAAATDAGRAYVFYGGPGADAVADVILTGAVASDEFGSSVSGVGDLNRDGYEDVIVGSFLNDTGGSNAGRVYAYYGGAVPDAVADLMLTGSAALDNFGFSVSSAGDMNGDGFADLIVGALGNDAGGSAAGAAYLYDLKRYFMLSPNGGETWNVGATKSISWLGAEPADVSLSVDGGRSFERLLPEPAGGSASNSVTIRVPHSPTKFARIQVTAANAGVGGFDGSDSTFTIQTSVALLALLAAPLPQGGASITWSTDPGPDDLAGYRLERAKGSEVWATVVALTRETAYTDPAGGPGTRYRLFAVNGLGESLLLGETSLRPLKPLAAWPLPYRGGNLTVSFATAGGLGAGGANTEVSIFDVRGRLVKRLARGAYPQGYNVIMWDGRDDGGRKVGSGIYFVRATSLGEQRTLRLSVLR